MLLPVILVLCGLAINLAYMQLVTTEMKVATDAASHAGGRAMSEAQRKGLAEAESGAARRNRIVQETYDAVDEALDWNLVRGNRVTVALNDEDVHFGYSFRQQDQMYEFVKVPVAQIRAGAERASSVGVVGTVDIPLAFQVLNFDNFVPRRRSIATQVDRDIALVIDTSGSMLYFKDLDLINETLEDLRNEVVRKRRLRRNRRGQYYYEYYEERRISNDDYEDALGNYRDNWGRDRQHEYYREFSDDVIEEIYNLYRRTDDEQYLDIFEYMEDWEDYATNTRGVVERASRHSRWELLAQGVEAFLDVLGGTPDGMEKGTDQKELVSLVTFANDATVQVALTDDDIREGGTSYYQNIRDRIYEIAPRGATSIGRGLEVGLPPIVDPDWARDNNFSGAAARPFAEKTIVVMTDGVNNGNPDPVAATQSIIAGNAVTIHTITFTNGANQLAMRDVADIGGGKAYHANDGTALIEIFEEIANNLPTILTGNRSDESNF